MEYLPLKPRKRVSKPGSFLEISLAPGYYTYARKLLSKPRYAFYDIISQSPERDVQKLMDLPILLTTALLDTPPWPLVGILPLDDVQFNMYRSWHEKSSMPSPEQMILRARLPGTSYFLIEETRDPVTGIYHTTETPAQPQELRGLGRHTIFPFDFVEENLRIHYGLTIDGHQITPIPFSQQEL